MYLFAVLDVVAITAIAITARQRISPVRWLGKICMHVCVFVCVCACDMRACVYMYVCPCEGVRMFTLSAFLWQTW